LTAAFKPLFALWTLAYEWFDNTGQWFDTRFASIRPEQMNTFILTAQKRITRLKRELSGHPVLVSRVLAPLTDQIEKLKCDMPLITKLKHPGIKARHWEDISRVIGFMVLPATKLTLQDILSMNLRQWNDQINEIAAVAAQESQFIVIVTVTFNFFEFFHFFDLISNSFRIDTNPINCFLFLFLFLFFSRINHNSSPSSSSICSISSTCSCSSISFQTHSELTPIQSITFYSCSCSSLESITIHRHRQPHHPRHHHRLLRLHLQFL
jgi:hypothetical protein